jgi:YidC/Oxa1 family membrane protein insertase
MDPFSLPLVSTVLDGAYRALMGLTHLFEPALGNMAAATVIVVVTLAVRAALIPVGVSQAKAERTRARLAPRFAELQRKHKKNPEALQRAMMKLYTDEGTTPWAGCLPMLAQAPVVGIIYMLFIRPEIAGHVNALLGHTLFGVPLGSSLVGSFTGGAATATTFVVFGVMVGAILLIGELTRRASRPGSPLAPPAAPAATSATPSLLAAPGMQRMLGALQFATAVIACFVPLAAALYLLVTVVWTLVQRVLLRRRYPLETG